MDKLVVFKIGKGSFEDGFPVTLEISQDSQPPYTDTQDCFPPAPEIPRLYEQWQGKYYGLAQVRRILKPARSQSTNISTRKDCEEAAKALEVHMKEWFQQPSLLNLRRHVLDEVGRHESARIIFQTQDELLQKLPWHLWDLFERRPQAEFSLSARYAPPALPLKRPVKILAILGGDEKLNVQKDLDILENLPGVRVRTLPKPEREKLNEKLWDRSWDILFFAGHSSSQEKDKSGVIQLNDTESFSLHELRHALEKAIQNGLKLAIFNSCDGLGLARDLADLKIPQVIVMREPVPDRVAQKFLRYFLKYFSKGESFYLAVRQAREKLQGMEGEFPCASWLPVICQNPSEKSPLWPQTLVIRVRTLFRQLWRSNKAAVFAGVALAVATLVILLNQKVPIPGISNTQTQNSAAIISPITDHFSKGEKLLIQSKTNSDKEAGIYAFSDGNLDDAIGHFRKSLQQNRNDPETLIYLNNAIAEQKAKANIAEKLEIAVSVPANVESNVAEEILRGVAQAQSQLNCGLDEISRAVRDAQSQLNCNGGINGKLLQVTIANDEDRPEIAKRVADAFVKKPEILGVIGHYSSETTLAARDVYEKGELVVVSPTSTAVSLSSFGRYIFRTTPSDAVAAQDLFNYMRRELGLVNVAVAYERENVYSESLKEEFKKLLPSQNFVFECDLSQGNFSGDDCVNQAKQQQAKVLLLIPGTKDTLDRAFRVVNRNNGDLRLLAGDAMYHSKTLKDYGEEAASSKMAIAVPWHRNPSSEFVQKAENLWPGAVNWRTAMAYDATQAAIEGLRKIKVGLAE